MKDIKGVAKLNFSYSDKVIQLQEKLTAFMEEHIYPNEEVFEQQLNEQEDPWATVPPIIEELKEKARAAGLWNLFLPDEEDGAGLTNLEYAPIAEIIGRSIIAPKALKSNPT